eukprot:2256992-Amphidinium_carterae.1
MSVLGSSSFGSKSLCDCYELVSQPLLIPSAFEEAPKQTKQHKLQPEMAGKSIQKLNNLKS